MVFYSTFVYEIDRILLYEIDRILLYEIDRIFKFLTIFFIGIAYVY